MKIKRENFFVIQGFMIEDLDLKGNELLVYALIYGFSQSENQYFTGSLNYLASWINSSKQTTMKILKNLIEKKLLKKEEVIKNNVKYCKYKALLNFNLTSKKTCIGIQETCIGDTKNLYRSMQENCMGIQETLPNNIDIIYKDKIENNIIIDEACASNSKKNLENNILSYINSLNISENYKNKLIEFYEYRKNIKKKIKTTRAIDFILNQDFENEEHAIACIDFAMGNEYIGVKAEYIDSKKFEKSFSTTIFTADGDDPDFKKLIF